MTSKVPRAAGKAAVAIGSAAIAAALLYSSRRKDRQEKDKPAPPHTPTGEPPQTD
ncbi:isopropylmalate isomerase [Porphyrobacter sp. GA68]|uniref:isopropylmalate isomerase n=1 Tax=Porphyrobacter sp. GA68 TaxID=2883480 RepID=UPI001D18F392|nr:isopropylmalate isomerase [Porphyrobacter sp. GA68]